MAEENIYFLLVEDDEKDILLVLKAFEAAGVCGVRIARNGQEAMDYMVGEGDFMARERYPLPNAIVLDLRLPLVDGLEFLEWLRREAPPTIRSTPVVVMSASQDPGDVGKAYELGANSYMVKPMEWRTLRERIEALCRYWCDHVATPVSV